MTKSLFPALRRFLTRCAATLAVLGLYLVGAMIGAGLILGGAAPAMAQRVQGQGQRQGRGDDGDRGGRRRRGRGGVVVVPPLVVAPPLVVPERRRRRRRYWED